MDTRISDGGGGEQLESFEDADAATVNNLGNQKPFMSPSVSWSSVFSTSERVSSSEPVIDSFNGEEEEEDEFEWVAVESEADVNTDKAPEIEEVEDAFSALQLMFNDDDDDDDKDQVSESEFVDWIEPPLQLCNNSLLQPYMLDRFYDAFHVFQTDPSVQRMVMSLASDRAVWDAVMNNEVVRELITNAERSGGEEEDSSISVNFIRRLLQTSAVRIMDAVERVTKYVADLLNGDETVVPGDDETVVLVTGAAPVIEKLQMTVLLTIVVLLLVFVTRATRAR